MVKLVLDNTHLMIETVTPYSKKREAFWIKEKSLLISYRLYTTKDYIFKKY